MSLTSWFQSREFSWKTFFVLAQALPREPRAEHHPGAPLYTDWEPPGEQKYPGVGEECFFIC